MKLFDRLIKKQEEKEAAESSRNKSDIRELEIYSDMRVVVETPEEKLLFIAKLQNPQGSTAQLYQYSDGEIFRDTGMEDYEEKGSVSVKLRGYNNRRRKAVFMEGVITPQAKHIWQVTDLTITKVENERSFSRLSTDIDGMITLYGETEANPCRLLDISAGGVSIGSQCRYHKGDKFLLSTKLLECGSPFTVYCEVLRVIEKGESVFEYGCEFVELTEVEQERIAQSMAQLRQSK